MLKDSEGFYIRLEKQLLESSSWPSIYKYKFILKSDKNSIDHLKSIFIDIDANISTKYSLNRWSISLFFILYVF